MSFCKTCACPEKYLQGYKQNNDLNTMSICFFYRTQKHVDLSAFYLMNQEE